MMVGGAPDARDKPSEGSRRRKAPADANKRVHVLADYGRGVGRRVQCITG